MPSLIDMSNQRFGRIFEEPRVESKDAFTCVGSDASRYNFREDLLRLLGNAVVEQTAEKAWITLWNKFL